MKCKVCGYEVDPSRDTCPMCGSKLEKNEPAKGSVKDSSEMNWSILNFPTPKAPKDIDMSWSGDSDMKIASRQNRKGLDPGYDSAFDKPKVSDEDRSMVSDASWGFASSEPKRKMVDEPMRWNTEGYPQRQPAAQAPDTAQSNFGGSAPSGNAQSAPRAAYPSNTYPDFTQRADARPMDAAPRGSQPAYGSEQPYPGYTQQPRPQYTQPEPKAPSYAPQPGPFDRPWTMPEQTPYPNQPLWQTQPVQIIQQPAAPAPYAASGSFSATVYPNNPAPQYTQAVVVPVTPQPPLYYSQPYTPQSFTPAPVYPQNPGYQQMPPKAPETYEPQYTAPQPAYRQPKSAACEEPVKPAAPPAAPTGAAEPEKPAENRVLQPAFVETVLTPDGSSEERRRAAEENFAGAKGETESPAVPETDEAGTQAQEADDLLKDLFGSADEPSIESKIGESLKPDNETVERSPEKFFTFTKKNEEFQALLDKEYEKISNLGIGIQTPELASSVIAGSIAAARKDNELSSFERMINETLREEPDEPDLTGPEAKGPEVQKSERISTGFTELGLELSDSPDPENEDGQTLVLGKSLLKSGVTSNTIVIDPQPSVFPDITDTLGEQAFTRDTIQSRIAAMKIEEANAERIRQERKQRLEEMSKARDDYFSNIEVEPIDYDSFVDDGPTAFGRFLRFIGILILIAGLLEGGTFALKRFAPDAGITENMSAAEQAVISFSVNTFNTVKEKVSGLFNRGGEEGEATDADGFNMDALLEQYNRNIESVSFDETLAYNDQTAYGVEGLADMEKAGDADTKALVYSSLIGYASNRIDYVNDGSEACFNYITADSAAYTATRALRREGRSEAFKELKLGDVLVNGDDVYVFANISIEVSADGNVSVQGGNRLYHLVKDGYIYKISDVSEF